MQSAIEIRVVSDLFILLIDLDRGKSITNNAHEVIAHVNKSIPIGPRRVYYRDTMGRFDELKVRENKFIGFAPCSDSQQLKLSELTDGGDCLICGEQDIPLHNGFCTECYDKN